MNRLLLFVFSVLVSSMFVAQAHALTLSPPSMEIEGDPGDRLQIEVRLYNETEASLSVSPSYLDFGAQEEGNGEPKFYENVQEDVDQLSSWFSASKEQVDVEPGEWVSLPIIVQIPQDAEPGGHFAAIFFGPRKIDDAGEGVGINYQTGSLVLLNVSGEATRKGVVKSLETFEGKSFFTSTPVLFEVKVENQGSVHFKPTGAIEVKSMLGKDAGTLDMIKTPTGGNVLPNSTRRYDLLWTEEESDEAPEGFFAQAFYQMKHFHFGKYSASLSVALPNGETGTGETSFWMIPLQLLSLVVVFLIVFIFGLKRYNRWIAHRARRSA